MRAGVHANGVARTSFDAHAAIDAAQRIYFVPDRVLLDRIVGIFSGLDVDAVSRASSGAQETSRAFGGVIRAESQAVAAAKGVGVGSSFLRILDRDIGLTGFRQTEDMQNVDGEITPKVITGDGETAQDLRQVRSLPERHVFNSFHRSHSLRKGS